ncbi:MAG: ATP-binding protein [Bacteroidota bacterium]
MIFREKATTAAKTVKENKQTAKGNNDLVRLEQELMQSREIIRTTTEEYESTYEELQTNNEMILSSNEELQSVNEELETSKEELQSANEELTTINEELFKRNLDLKESQSFADAIIQTVHNPLLVLTVNLQVRMANRAFYKTFKLDRESTEGSFLYELGDNAWDIAALREHLKDLFPDKSSFKDFELKHMFPGLGEKMLVVNAYKLEKNDDIKETLILLALDDVTRRLHAESSLLKTQEQLKLSLIGDSIGTWWWDLKSNSMKWSRENEILNGVKEGTFNGTYADWENLIDLGDLSTVQKALKRNIIERSAVEIEYRIRRPDRSVRWIMSKGHVYYGTDERPERMIGVSIDITDRKMQSDALELKVDQRTGELKTALENLKHVNQQLEEFAFISSHDLQEPLRKITTFASLLSREDANLNEYSKRYVLKMQASTEKMSSLLKGLLRYATLLKTDPDDRKSVDLDRIMDRVEKYHEEILKEKSARIERLGLGTIEGYDEHLFQLFCHLVSNALKFSKASPVVRISGSILDPSELAAYPQLDKNKEYIVIDVMDNGIGFEQKYANKIFQMFQKLNERQSKDGTGLGLAICKKIVDEHEGIIYATGILNAGATFTIILPVR